MAGPWEQYAAPAPSAEVAGPWMQFAPAPATPPPDGTLTDTLADVARSAGRGLVKGAIATVALPGEARDLIGSGVKMAGRALGLPEPPPDIEKQAPSLFPSEATLRAPIESTFGKFEKPETMAGRYAQTVGEFAPAALAPGGLVRKAVQVLAPAAASETAGQATEGTAVEPYARVGGAVLGSIAGHKLTAPAVAPEVIPSVEQLKTASRAGYQHPEVLAVEIKPAAVAGQAKTIAAELNLQGFRPLGAPQTYALVEELKTVPGATARVADIDSVRSALGKVAREVDAKGAPTADAVAAGRAGRQIDKFMGGLQQPDLVAGNAAKAAAILSDARRDWGAAMRAEDLGVRLTRAERQAAKSGSGSNIDNAIRQKVSAILDVPSRSVGWTAVEKQAAEEVVRGTASRNALRKFGKLGFGDGLSLLMHTGAAIPTGGATIPIGIAGTVARKAAERSTSSAATRLDEMLRSRSAEAEKWLAMQARIAAAQPQLPGPAASGGISGLLAAQPAFSFGSLAPIGVP